MKQKKKKFIPIKVKNLIEWNEPNGEGCIVSDKITVEGYKVGYMVRENPMSEYPDSGWCFMAGNEDDKYMSDPNHHNIFALNTICNYDPDIIPYLHAKTGSAFIRIDSRNFEEDDGRNRFLLKSKTGDIKNTMSNIEFAATAVIEEIHNSLNYTKESVQI